MATEEQLANLEKKMDRRFHNMQKSLYLFKKEIRQELQPFHDYLIGQEAIMKIKNSSNINLSRDVFGLITKLVLIIAALLGVNTIK